MQAQTAIYPYLHPLKPVTFGSEMPQLAGGSGIHVQDTDGRVYIDGISGLWNVSLGYGHPALVRAISEQLERLPFVNPVDYGNPVTLEYASRLLGLLPEPLVKLGFTCTGSESNELAIKLARKYFRLTGKPHKSLIAAMDVSYHGTYYGAMSASGMDRHIAEGYGPVLPGFVFVPVPFCSCCREPDAEEACLNNTLEELDAWFNRYGDRLAAFMLEPILGSAGVLPVPERYMTRLQALCAEHDVLLIMDEVATGFGRTGKMFAFEHTGAVPDILCLSKGINGGYLPLGATVFARKIYEAFADAGTHVEHLSTQNGSPIACAAGLAALRVIEEERMLERVEASGNMLRDELRSAIGKHKNVFEIRGQGLMIGVALVKNRAELEGLQPEQIHYVVRQCRQKGLLVYPFYTPLATGFHLLPPFIISQEDIGRIVRIVKQVMDRTVF